MDEHARSLLASPRVMVLLYVPWSIHAVRSQTAFRRAVDLLFSSGVASVELDEDQPGTGSWLAQLGVKRLQAACTLGAGTIVWLENGAVVDYEISPSMMSADDLVSRTRARWS